MFCYLEVKKGLRYIKGDEILLVIDNHSTTVLSLQDTCMLHF